MRKTITIKNALIDDKAYLDNLATSLDKSVAEAFSHLVNVAKTSKTSQEIEENAGMIANLNTEILSYKSDLERIQFDFEALEKENSELKNRKPETVEKVVEKTVEKTIEKPLTGNQFICDLPDDIIIAARLIRSFAKKDGFIKPDSDGLKYANELTIVSLKQFINRHYIDIIDEKL